MIKYIYFSSYLLSSFFFSATLCCVIAFIGHEENGVGVGQKLSINLSQQQQKPEEPTEGGGKSSGQGLFMSDGPSSSHSLFLSPSSSSSSSSLLSQSSSTWIKSGSERNYHQNPIANHSSFSTGIELIVQTNGKPSVVLSAPSFPARNSGSSDTRHSHHGSSLISGKIPLSLISLPYL